MNDAVTHLEHHVIRIHVLDAVDLVLSLILREGDRFGGPDATKERANRCECGMDHKIMAMLWTVQPSAVSRRLRARVCVFVCVCACA